MPDTYWRDLLRGTGASEGHGSSGSDSPNTDFGGGPPPGGWKDLPAFDDANSQAAVDRWNLMNPADAGAGAPATPGAMPFDENARASNLYSGGFVPVINYGWANQGNVGLQASANPYAGYSTGQRQLDQGLATLYGKPEDAALAGSVAGGTAATPDAATSSSTPAPSASAGGGGGGPGGGGGAGHMNDDMNADLKRFLYGA